MSLAFDLIDRLISLVRRSEEVDRARYDEIVKTLMADVDTLHRDYLTSFRNYHDSLAGKKELDAAFLEKVATDSLFSRDLRARVRALVESEADPRLQPLMRAVQSYLELAVVNPLEEWDASVSYAAGQYRWYRERRQEPPYDDVDTLLKRTLEDWNVLFIMNSARLQLANGISTVPEKGLSPELAARLAVRMIESLVVELQNRYAVITRAHNDIRKKLLKPK